MAKETKDEKAKIKNIGHTFLVESSKKFQQLKKELRIGTQVSMTGITNLVVSYEDPALVDSFLKNCFESLEAKKANRDPLEELYKETLGIDAVELQAGQPGRGIAANYLETLIFGSVEEESNPEQADLKMPKTDPQTGKRKRRPDGFINRTEVLTNKFKDRLLVIRNLDYCLDFCQQKAGLVDARNLWIFDNFRHPNTKIRCRILLVTNEPLKFPFKVKTLKIDPVDEHEAENIIESFINLCSGKDYTININETQRKQIIRKLCGLTYTEASDAFASALVMFMGDENTSKEIDASKVIRHLREKINMNFMEDAVGLSHLTSRPWEDYICPENSSFTFDVKKILRDFNEINSLKEEEKLILKEKKDNAQIAQKMDAIRCRMPHVIVLYGRGGVGKSAYPIHFAGLLDFDVWDFNINASHSKWIGEGSERMREALAKISKSSHVVVRIDEYDRAMGSTEGSGQGMHEAHKQVESEFMNWLQNSQENNLFAKNDIFIVLTTNHKENITGPLLRSGRADLVININEFDEKSMKETFVSAPRRMKNRGVIPPAGYNDFESFAQAINKLDLDKLISIAAQKGFTVRDVDTLLIEMATHDYYYKKNGKGIPWTTEMFEKVLSRSVGSATSETTSELILGDRFLAEDEEKKENLQSEFGFAKDYTSSFDIDKFTDVDFFK